MSGDKIANTTAGVTSRGARQAMLAVAVLILVAASAAFLHWSGRSYDTVTLRIGDAATVRALVADTPTKRSKGLAIRDSLSEAEGMYFVFPEAAQPLFWMKDMKFPIDILWIRGDELVDITTDVPVPVSSGDLPQYAPMVMVDRVLEVPAGFAQRHGLRLGLKVTPVLDSFLGVR